MMSMALVKMALRDREFLMKKPEYVNAINPRYETIRYGAIWGICILSIILYSIIEILNFLPHFTFNDETDYIFAIELSSLAANIILSPKEKHGKFKKENTKI